MILFTTAGVKEDFFNACVEFDDKDCVWSTTENAKHLMYYSRKGVVAYLEMKGFYYHDFSKQQKAV